MKKVRVLILFVLFCDASSAIAIAGSQPKSLANGEAAKYGKLPLSFEPNRGQTDSQVQFLARGRGYTLFLSASQAVFSFPSGGSSDSSAARPSSFIRSNDPAQFSSLRLRLLGASSEARAEGSEVLPGRSNYFVGTDQNRWRTNVPQFGRVRYRDVYPGIDLVYYGNQGRLEHDFVVAPGASPRAIYLGIDGADKSDISSRGNLVLHLPDGDMCLQKPIAYQQFGKFKREVTVHYVLRGNEVSFEVGAYDRGLPLVIDPVLLYSTFLGGSKFDSAFGIAVDSTGHVYVTGQTSSINFPKTTLRVFKGVDDVFVAKLNAAGTGLLYSTYLGGNANDIAKAIAVDAFGNAYIAGTTRSTDFPTTSGAFQTAVSCTETPFGGVACGSAFVAKLGSQGSLSYSTALGGLDDVGDVTLANAIAVDAAGNAYVTGTTFDSTPVTPGAFQQQACVPPGAATPLLGMHACITSFVTKINSTGSDLVYSTFLGGNSGADSPGENGNGIAVDSAGHAYVTGSTGSADFPITPGALKTVFPPASVFTGFVTKMSPDGSSLVYSTFLGGSLADIPHAIAIDTNGHAYLAGQTQSTDFPVTPGAFQSKCKVDINNSCLDAFVSKLNPAGSQLAYATFLGGSSAFDIAQGIAVDSYGDAFVTGYTNSPDFPVTSNKLQGFSGGFCGTNFRCLIGFVTTLNTSGTATAFYSTFLGGTGSDFGNGIALDKAGNAYVAGQTASNNFPATSGAFQTTYHGGIDAFVSKLVVAADLSTTMSPSPASVVRGSNLTYSIGVFNKGPDGSDGDLLTDTIPAGTTFVSATTTNGTCTVPGVGGTGTLTCKRANRLLTGHWWGPVTLTVKVQAASGSTINNTVRVKSTTQDLVVANNTTTFATHVQ